MGGCTFRTGVYREIECGKNGSGMGYTVKKGREGMP